MKGRLLPVFALLLVSWASVGLGLGQAASCTVTGTVLDNSNAVVPGADVTATHAGTGFERRTVTSAEGFFSIPAIPAGTYTVTIEMPGFAKWQRTNIVLYAGDKINIPDIVLNVAGAAEEVTVSAAPDSVTPVDSGEKSAIITAKQIQNLAILGRSAVELLKILPGVVYGGDPSQVTEIPGLVVQFNLSVGNYNVMGTKGEGGLNIVSDGANVIDPGCDCGAAVNPNVDMIQEVKVQVANFGAEYAKGPVTINTVTKSGTSEFHGSAYIYMRHPKWNAQDWRANRFNTPKPQDKFFYPGFTLGGPLTKSRDKVFFFFGYEYMFQDHDLGVNAAAVPTAKMRLGDFSEIADGYILNGYDVVNLPKATGISSRGVIDSKLLDPGGRVLMNLYPPPNRDPKQNNGWNFVASIINPEHRHQELTRIDWAISDKTTLYTRFNHEYQSSPYPYTLWWYNTQQVPNPTNVQGDYNTWSSSTSIARVIDPTTTNEVVVAATYWGMPHKLVDPQKVSRKALGYPYRGIFKNTHTDYVPNITDWGGGVATLHQAGGIVDPTIFGNKWLVSVEDNFSKVYSTHTMKFGARFELITNDEPTTNDDAGLVTPTTWGGNSTGNAYADLIMGRMGYYQESTKNIVGYTRRRWWDFYAQDSWKVTRRLTLELGSRFTHPGFFYDTEGKMCGFDATKYKPTSKITDYTGLVCAYRGDDVGRSVWKTPRLVISPRLGFAYDITGKGNTVIRGGAGKFIFHGRGGDSFGGTTANPPLHQNVVLGWNPGTLAEIDKIDGRTQIQASGLTVLEPLNDKVPTTYSFSLTISQRLGWDTFLESSYVGSASTHQLGPGGKNINIVPEGSMFGFPKGTDDNSYRLYQNYGAIAMRSHFLSQNYHSLQVMLNRQTGRVNFSSAYTFAKTLGVGGATWGGTAPVDPFDYRRRSYGPLTYDRTHSLSLAYNILLPDATQEPVLREIVNGWQISGISQWQSGAPLIGFRYGGSMVDGQPMNIRLISGTIDTSAQPIVICDPRKNLSEGQYANPSCFVAPEVRKNGHYRFPYMRGPAFQNHDLSIFKNFKIGASEDEKIQVRFSAYNFPNHPIPFIDSTGDSLVFDKGKPNATTLKNFGRAAQKRGRRLFQFAIKYMF